MVAANIGDVSFALQSAKGAGATAGQWRLYPAGGEQPHAVAEVQDLEEMSGLRMLNDAFIGEVAVGGSTEFFVRPETIAPLLYGVLGAQAVAGAGDPYTHTFTPAAAVPYFTFWRMLGNGLAEKFEDCIIGRLQLHGESYQPLRVTVDVMGITPSYVTPAEDTADPETTNRFMHSDAAGALKVEGAAVSCISSFDVNIDNGATPVPGDGISACDIAVGRLTVTADTTQHLDDFDLWNRAHYGSATPADGAPHVTTPLELAGEPAGLDWLWTRVAASRTLEILIPRVIVGPFDLQGNVSGDPMTQEVTYRAYQPASGASITAIVKNATSGLYTDSNP